MNTKPLTKLSEISQGGTELWETFPIYEEDSLREVFWQNYETAIRDSQKKRQSHLVIKASTYTSRRALKPQMIASPQLFTIDPNQRTPFLKKLWAYQVWPIAKAFTVAWLAMSIFFSVINKDGNSYQLLSISAMLLLFFIAGIAYHYWVICRPLADMQLIIDRLGIMREGAGLDHLSIKYSEIADVRKGPIGLQICLKPRGRIQEDRESILLPGALCNYRLVCELLEHHLAHNNQYYHLTS
ncbi:hypothetical protein BKI52_21775 [marine bacterium AO1-C]|nr:hypothetical protein BKI52_21775 [marine bacterium AO1-C]